jgi:hypothetical protein
VPEEFVPDSAAARASPRPRRKVGSKASSCNP